MIGRAERLQSAQGAPFDVVVVGGGITGAGVFRLAAQHGLRVLLLEQRDFAWGTSSRSGKLVHGGLRYLAQLKLTTALRSVRERERLLAAYPHLVQAQDLLVVPPGRRRSVSCGAGAVIGAYERLAGRHDRQWLDAAAVNHRVPELRQLPLGAWVTRDAYTDDARLVLRVIDEGREAGGCAINYCRVREVRRDRRGGVVGVMVEDQAPGGVGTFEVDARVVVNATGAWSDALRGGTPRIRPLRGSHLLFRARHVPLDCLVGLRHPGDGRAMYVTPWQGRILLGTTDLDHEADLDEEPVMTPAEGRYLLEALEHWFPEVRLAPHHVISTMAGVRPVVGMGHADPSRESREEQVWAQDALVTVSGGKLTTFAHMARRTLLAAAPWLGTGRIGREHPPPRAPADVATEPRRQRLWGRYGRRSRTLFDREPRPVADTAYEWGEVAVAAHEDVVHLDDLMLRRLRLGILLERGASEQLPAVRDAASATLGWDEARWRSEVARYRALWARAYGTTALEASGAP